MPLHKYPDAEHESGEAKSYKSPLHGFIVDWVQIDELSQTTPPGIHIRLSMPNHTISENHYFPFGDESRAEEKYLALVKRANLWDSIQANG